MRERDSPSPSRPSMLNTMLSRERRKISKMSLPGPLVLKKASHSSEHALRTPPPTGCKNFSPKDFPKSSLPHLHMPCTPITPLIFQRETGEVRKQETLVAQSVPEDDKDAHALKQITTTDQSKIRKGEGRESLKRARSSDDAHDTPSYTTKRRLQCKDLIDNPLVEMSRLGVPETFFRQNLTRVASQRFGCAQQASCFVRARKALNRTQSLRVRVIPKADPENSFYMRFRNSLLTKTTSSPEKLIEEGDTEDEFNEDDSPCIPLHTEVALFRAPLLGNLLLSGKILRGDIIEIYLPRPEMLYSTLYWMYTGQIPFANRKKVEECLSFLCQL